MSGLKKADDLKEAVSKIDKIDMSEFKPPKNLERRVRQYLKRHQEISLGRCRRWARPTQRWPMSIRRRNFISEQYSACLISMLESPTYCALSRFAQLVISRIEIELAHYVATTRDGCPSRIGTSSNTACTMRRSHLRSARQALGFIKVERGRGGCLLARPLA